MNGPVMQIQVCKSDITIITQCEDTTAISELHVQLFSNE